MSFLCKFQKQPALAEEAPVVSTTLSIPFSGPAERSLYFTENPDFTAPSAGIHSRRFPGSRIFLYSSDPEHDLAAVPSSLFDVDGSSLIYLNTATRTNLSIATNHVLSILFPGTFVSPPPNV